jgi:hypothetical protein
VQSRLKGAAAGLALLAVAASACGGSTTSGKPRQNADLAVVPGAGSVDGIPEAAVDALKLERAKAKRLGTFKLQHGPRAVYIAPTTKGTTCFLDVGDVDVGAGCDATLFSEHEVAWTESFRGGPALAAITELRVAGVAAASARGLSVELSNGDRVSVPLNAGRAFMYEAAPSDLHTAVVPKTLLAFDGDGEEIDRVELPPLPPAG